MFGGQQNNSGTNAFSGFTANNNTNSNTSSQQGGTSVFGASKSAESNAFGASNSTSKPLFSSGAQQQSSSTPAFGAPNPVLRLEMLVPINPTHLDQHLVLLLKQGIIWSQHS